MRSPFDILYNFHWVVPGHLARSAQAYIGFLSRFLVRHRIRSVINLRGANPHFAWWRYEKSCCARLGVTHVDIPFNSRNLPSRTMLLDILEAVGRAEPPVLIKCSGGQDRTSFAAALYLAHQDSRKSAGAAIDQMRAWPYLHFPKKQQRWLKEFFSYAGERPGSKSMMNWLREDYSPEGFREWLHAAGRAGTYRT